MDLHCICCCNNSFLQVPTISWAPTLYHQWHPSSTVIPCSECDTYRNRYHMWAIILIEYVIPRILLLLLNSAIIKMFYCSDNSISDVENNNRKNRATIRKTLPATVVVCLMRQILCLIYKLLYHLGSKDNAFCSNWYLITPIKKLALMINSSLNVIIYCVLGTTFGAEFLHLFGYKTAA